MRKILFALTLILIVPFTGYSQNKYDKFWDLLLNNKREEAFKALNKIKDKSIKNLMVNEILRVENGKLTNNDAFLDGFIKQPDFEYYLYAAWNEPFMFDTYLTTGFNKKNMANIDKIFNTEIKNPAMKDAVNYIKSAAIRHQNDWSTYYTLNDEILSLRKWEYCGVFENLNKSGLDKYYEPEDNAYSEQPFDAKSNGTVNWFKANTEKEAYQFFTNHEEYGAGVHYAQTFIEMPEDKRVILRLGNGSAFKVWLNDVLVLENDKDVIRELNAYHVEVNLPKGINRLLIKNAESGYGSYFIASILDTQRNPIANIKHTSKYSPYNKSREQDINPVVLTNDFEEFFIKKRKENPGDFFYDYCLARTYFRNSRYEEAKEIIQPWIEKYPKSSLVRKLLISAYDLENDYTSINELRENIEIDDPDYYLPLVLKIADSRELSRMSLDELEKFLNKFRNSIDLKLFDYTADFFLNARKGDRAELRKNLDGLLKESEGNVRLQLRYAPLYASLYEDDETTIKILEKIHKNYFFPQASESLAYYYDKQGKKNKSVEAISKDITDLKNDNNYLYTIIEKLHDYERYEESLEYIDAALENFPYSFIMKELKGDALLQLNKKQEAIKLYEESLKYNSSYSKLRNKIKDLKNEKHLLEQLIPEDVYGFIKDNKGKITSNNYGFNILLDEGNVELYPEGGGKYRFIYAYEITSDSGVERFKEYNLGLSGNYTILKSEIVKKDGNIVPADRSGSNFVFNGLAIGDVVYIDYENSFSSTGRFYKDYVDYFQFDSFHPIVNTSFQVLVPNSLTLYHEVMNGDVEFKKKSVNDHTLYEWTLKDDAGMAQDEYYMPANVDVARSLHVSTIGDWNDIAKWYSDLVRSRLEINSTVKDVFNELFPNGYKQLSQEERARKIYKYIADNLTYSYVSFRQSGYVPQKPSKTINTSLGDCKDFSTLFVTLGRMAELDTNLVLILTSDYGQNSLVLPSQDFNHCIAKVNLDGKEQFLELTDKYLPFASLPTSLRGATALEIPYEVTPQMNSELFKLDNVNRDDAVFRNDVKVSVGEENTKLDIKTELTGHINSHYSSLLAEPNFEVKKKSFFEDLKNRMEDDLTLDELKDISNLEDGKTIKFTSLVTLNKQLDKIGSINILKLPKIARVYTNSIVETQDRKYPIEYIQYEKVDKYETKLNITIPSGKKFIEIPEDKILTFKDHSYSITYKTVSDSVLDVSIIATPGTANIKPEDYIEFRKFVKAVLEAEDSLIGFK